MNQRDNVADQLKELLDMYEFSMDTLSKYLQLPVEQIRKLSEGDVGFLPEDSIYRLDLCQCFGQKKSKDYAAFLSSSSSFCCGVM